ALRVSKGHERVDEPPRRIRSDCRVRRMLVDLRRAAGHLDVQDAFASELNFRSSLVEMVAALDRRAVRVQDVLVRTDEGAKVGTADLLLALDHELQVDRRPAFDAIPGLDREDLHDQVALLIRAPASPSTRAGTSMRANPRTRDVKVGAPYEPDACSGAGVQPRLADPHRIARKE